MRKLLLIISCIYFSVTASAQKIYFTDTANTWKELQPQYNAPNNPLLHYSTYSFIKDTAIHSVIYKWFSFDYDQSCSGCGSFVREDTLLKRVYIRNVVGDTDIVLMDYNLRVGDTFNAPHYRFIVSGIDSTLINSVWHKVWLFPPIIGGIFGSDTIYFIEGVGCIQHPTYMLWEFAGCVECMQPFMFCFSNHGIAPPLSPAISFLDNTTSCVVFPTLSVNAVKSNGESIELFPNPATNQLTIASKNVITNLTISNLLGQIVYVNDFGIFTVHIDVSNFSSGLYFIRINGTELRKFVKN